MPYSNNMLGNINNLLDWQYYGIVSFPHIHPPTDELPPGCCMFYLPTHRFPVIRPLVLSVHLYLHATIRLADLTPFSLTCICESSISPSSGHIFHTLSYLLFYCYISRLSYCIVIIL